jgi:hypothetical protein
MNNSNKSNKSPSSEIPNLDGKKFEVTEWFIQSGIHKIDSPQSKSYTCTFKQRGHFVSSKDKFKNECLGIWHDTCNGWQLIMSIDKEDNGVFYFTPTKMSENNNVLEMKGTVLKCGTLPNILLNTVNTIYDIMPQYIKKNINEVYSKTSSSLRKNTKQILKVAHMSCKRIE